MSFVLYKYKDGFGYIYYESSYYWFTWKNVMTLSPKFWNTVCLTYSFNTNSIFLMINGQLVLNETAKKLKESSSKNFSNYTITLELTQNGGQLSDFNFWSNPLSLEDLREYSEGCNNTGSGGK